MQLGSISNSTVGFLGQYEGFIPFTGAFGACVVAVDGLPGGWTAAIHEGTSAVAISGSAPLLPQTISLNVTVRDSLGSSAVGTFSIRVSGLFGWFRKTGK